MPQDVFLREELLSQFRSRRAEDIFESVPHALVEERLAQGWEVVRQNKTSTRMKRPKPHGVLVEDRVWTLLYKMGFPLMSGEGGLELPAPTTGKGNAGTNQIDVVAIDDEAAIAVECKSLAASGKREDFQGELGKFKLLQERFTKYVRELNGEKNRRAVAMVMVLHNARLSNEDLERAREAKVAVLDARDLRYFEQITDHLGMAARYQFLADVMAGRRVPELALTVPAIRSRMGKHTAYTFSISPEYLQKIAYVSHRAKGKASDVNAYQRMIKKSRLAAIRKYIEEDSNIFPTNIVVSLNSRARFEQTRNEGQSSDDLGWLHLEPSYKSAWIIDGQHRLFAYSGTQRASTSRLSVLAFEELEPSMQAQLFIDINAEQKAVKKDLLHELFAELHWNSDDIPSRTKAVITKAIQVMDQDPESPFFGRIIAAEGSRDAKRCISLTTLFKALHQPELFMGYARGGKVEKPGIFWSNDNDSMMHRTALLLSGWFSELREINQDWWDIGSGPGGGLSMNDSVASQIMVIRSVAEHLKASGNNLYDYDDETALGKLRPFARIVSEYLSSFDAHDRARYRDLRGTQGQTTRMRRSQKAIRDRLPAFDPPGLEAFIQEELAETNVRAREIVDSLETSIQEVVVSELKRHFGEEDDAWWIDGIPRPVRAAAARLQEEDDSSRGATYNYFNLIDYRRIVQDNWTLFEPIFGFGGKNQSKDKKTAWMQDLNDVRKIVAHASSGKTVSIEQLEQITEYQEEFGKRILNPV